MSYFYLDYTNMCLLYFRFKGAWWYTACHASNLNGFYHAGEHESYADGVNWRPWHGYYYSLKKTAMMIRPAY